MENYLSAQDVINEIHAAIGDGDKHGLRNTEALMNALECKPSVPVIHIAGTNGKGSTCAMLASVLLEAGFHPGLYTSPFLQIYNERIRLDGRPVPDELLLQCGKQVLEAAQALKQRNIHCTPFELGTVLALNVFKTAGCDIIVLETGMGGRLDPTNVLEKPTVCGITAIGMDHMHFLGDTLSAIAGEKAGIIKPCVPVVVQPQEEEVMAVIREKARQCHAPVTETKRSMVRILSADAHGFHADFTLPGDPARQWSDLEIPLPGEHQLLNTLTVLGVLSRLPFRIPEDAVRRGIAKTRWPARLEWCGNVLLDGAHNAQGISALADYREHFLHDRETVLLLGVLSEKLTPEMLHGFRRLGKRVITVTPESTRAMSAEQFASCLCGEGLDATPASSIAAGLEEARKLAGNEKIIIAAGSLYFTGALRSVLGLKP